MCLSNIKDLKIAVVGLGYVGLPLAVLFSSKYLTIGYDTNNHRVGEINGGFDKTGEGSCEDLNKALKNDFLSRFFI